MNASPILAALLVLAVLLAWGRLLRWQLGRPPEARSAPWRLALLFVAQPLCAGLLYLALVPPPARTTAGTLVVATRGAGALPALVGGRVVALPEAPTIAAGERVPDLGTALRRYPDTARVVVVGEGLSPRDRDTAHGLEIDFRPAAAPSGLVHIEPPATVAPGGAFDVAGRIAGVTGGTVDLIDPAGQRVDSRAIGGDGGFVLRGTVRGAGTALFELRRRNAAGRIVERADVPVVTVDERAPRLLLIAGAPSPETKFLRRWAIDAGIDIDARMALGGGVAIGDAPAGITRAMLDRFDLAILDERSWSGLGAGERAALLGAVRGGLGLLLRVTGPIPDAVRRQWQALGFAVSGGSDVATWGPGGAAAPLTRRVLRVGARDAVSLSPDPRAVAVSAWRAEGRGRVALWPLADTYVLSLDGRGADHAALWSGTVATLARGRAISRPRIEGLPRAGTRVAICGLFGAPVVEQPGGRRARLVAEAGCAAFWPDRAGWHVARPASLPFYVHAANALPGVRAAEARDATLRLAATPNDRPTSAAPAQPGASWPWFLAWLAVSSALWWFERARRTTDAGSNP